MFNQSIFLYDSNFNKILQKYKPISAPISTDFLSSSPNFVTSLKPKLTPKPANGCILCAASLKYKNKCK